MPEKQTGNWNSNFHHGNISLEKIALLGGFVTNPWCPNSDDGQLDFKGKGEF